MNTHPDFKDDPLRDYLKPLMTEEAPEGFTEKIMTRVSFEPRPVRAAEDFRKIRLVPVISLMVILALTATALLLPSAGFGTGTLQFMKIFKNISLQAYQLDLDSLLKIRLPAYIPYLFLCIFLLSIFDRALNILFHRGK